MANIELDGTNKKIIVDSGDLTLDIPGDIILDADGANVTFKDGGTSVLDLSNSSTDAVLTVSTQDKDLIIKGDDGGSAITAATFDMSDAGTLVLNHDLRIADAGYIGSASDSDAIAIASNGVVTFSQAPVFPDGSLNIADIDLDGGTDIGAAIVDADLFLIDDGAGGTMRKTTASRLKTYVGSGLSEVDLWRVTSNFTGATLVTSNWERCDTNFEVIGSGMTESSGVFTFPSTGKWLVDFHISEFQGSYETTGGLKIEVSTDGGSSFASNAETYMTIASVSSATAYATGDARVILDVTNTSNFQVRFYVWNSSATVYGSSTVNYTYATFKKYGDT